MQLDEVHCNLFEPEHDEEMVIEEVNGIVEHAFCFGTECSRDRTESNEICSVLNEFKDSSVDLCRKCQAWGSRQFRAERESHGEGRTVSRLVG